MKPAAEARDKFEKALVFNIGLIAKKLQEAGFNSTELDKIGDGALKYIQEKAAEVTTKNPLEAGNIENLIIMVLMHGAITSQKKFIDETARRNGVSYEKITELMMKDTVGDQQK